MNTITSVRLGCPKNQIDSEVMEALLKDAGWGIASGQKAAHVVLINTCAFIDEAKQEAVDEILRAVDMKERGLCDYIIVAGCLPQRYGAALEAELPEVDLFIGTGEVSRIGEHAASLDRPGAPRTVVGEPGFLAGAGLPRNLPEAPFVAAVKIAEGCSNNCSYCIIPSVRGPFRSRPPDDILLEAERLAALGTVELVLTAQETTAYGADLPGRPTLAGLMKDLSRLDGIRWVRLLYTNPRRIDGALLRVMAEEERILPYIDVPVQHVDDDILRAMNRRYDGAFLRGLLRTIRRDLPPVVLRTSLITGFPGERREHFRRLVDFVKEARFDHLGVFPYSREEGTPAASLPGQVRPAARETRRGIIMREQAKISRELNRDRIGSVVEVLIEGDADRAGYDRRGRASFQAPVIDGGVFVALTDTAPGTIVRCRVTGADAYDLFGEAVR